MIPEMSLRIDKVRKRMAELRLDAFLIRSLVNIRYLFGFTGSNAIALITSDLCYFVTDRRYSLQAEQEVKGAEILIGRQDLYAELKEKDILKSQMRLAIEALHLTVKEFLHLKKLFPKVQIVGSEHIVEQIASIKDADEIEQIQRAGQICGRVLRDLHSLIKPGVRELEISAEISYRSRIYGSERDPFEPIVASGARSALPHGISSTKEINNGEFIIVDFGAVVHGYAADFTRTFFTGEPTKKHRDIANAISNTLQIAQEKLKPGMSGQELDKLAKDYLLQTEYGKTFTHSLGHGLGLEVHALPRIGEKSKDLLRPGQVVTLEPGVYLPGFGGCRVEDDFLIQEAGVQNLTPFPRELICVN